MAANGSRPINHRRSRLEQTDRTLPAISVGPRKNRHAKSLVIAALCLTQFACTRRGTPETIKIPLQTCSGLPCVDATFGGTKLKLVISLADQNSYLSPAGAAKADTHRNAKEFGKVRQFKLGSVQLSDIFAVDETLSELLGKAPDAVSPPIDGTLSYNAFSERLFVLNIPGHVIEISAEALKSPACPGVCSQLQDSRAADTADVKTLTTDGFAVGNMALHAQLDTVFVGSVATAKPIRGLSLDSTQPTDGVYRGSKLSYLGTAPVYFEGKPVASAAPVFGAAHLSVAGIQFDSAIGLSVLSTGAYAFDLRSMKMWRYQ
jgi:hypothetical protein